MVFVLVCSIIYLRSRTSVHSQLYCHNPSSPDFKSETTRVCNPVWLLVHQHWVRDQYHHLLCCFLYNCISGTSSIVQHPAVDMLLGCFHVQTISYYAVRWWWLTSADNTGWKLNRCQLKWRQSDFQLLRQKNGLLVFFVWISGWLVILVVFCYNLVWFSTGEILSKLKSITITQHSSCSMTL